MLLIELHEKKPRKHVAFAYGRMNPPTVGHAQLMKTLASASEGGDWYLFLSHTQDGKKNPLNWSEKVYFLQAIYPQYKDHIVMEEGVRTIMDVLQQLYNTGYTDITMVAGQDRLLEFKVLIEKYNGVETPKTYYKFDTIKFVSSGARDPDSDGIAGASASAARKAVLDDDYAQFQKITGSGKYSKQLWLKLKNAMSLKEMGGVGVVATNKKMAKDPRYSTSMTQDVGTNTFMNNLKALKLAEKEK